MKKLSLLLMVLIFLLVGCGNAENTSKNSDDDNIKKVSAGGSQVSGDGDIIKAEGYEFENNGINIAMNAKVAPILKRLGEASDYFEAKSCAFEGLDKIYTYNSFELYTYEMKEVDYVAAVIFLDDSISTKEGIYLGSTLDDVLAVYGDEYTEELGLYTYELDKAKISFIIEDDEVTSIEYKAITE